MQVVVTKEIKSAYTGKVLRKLKVINPELCVDTMKKEVNLLTQKVNKFKERVGFPILFSYI